MDSVNQITGDPVWVAFNQYARNMIAEMMLDGNASIIQTRSGFTIFLEVDEYKKRIGGMDS